MLSEEELS